MVDFKLVVQNIGKNLKFKLMWKFMVYAVICRKQWRVIKFRYDPWVKKPFYRMVRIMKYLP